MFERFTHEAREVVVLAQEEARVLRHNYLGTEHLLLGVLRQQSGLAVSALRSRGATLERVRGTVVQIVGIGDEVTSGEVPFTPRAKDALELALRQARAQSHEQIGSAHVVLGLIREGEGVAARVVEDLGIGLDSLREDLILAMVGSGAARPGPETKPLPYSEELAVVLRRAEELAREHDADRVDPSHLREALDAGSEDPP